MSSADRKNEKSKSDKPANQKLVSTLSELESALSSWEELAGLTPSPSAGAAATPKADSQHAIEMRNRTRELLEQLKAQIDLL
ncbi:MAG: hypothetical protein JNJ49_01785 [Bdellovibrionaceae bacterium]|nr:hypothetical protein [Pseudobdellovibrionaceae bacterium]